MKPNEIQAAYERLSMIHTETMVENVRLRREIYRLRSRLTPWDWVMYKLRKFLNKDEWGEK